MIWSKFRLYGRKMFPSYMKVTLDNQTIKSVCCSSLIMLVYCICMKVQFFGTMASDRMKMNENPSLKACCTSSAHQANSLLWANTPAVLQQPSCSHAHIHEQPILLDVGMNKTACSWNMRTVIWRTLKRNYEEELFIVKRALIAICITEGQVKPLLRHGYLFYLTNSVFKVKGFA